MAWIEPKTDWFGQTDSNGNYVGDRFNADDFNRIKNNLDYLRDIAVGLYKTFSIVSLGEDRTYSDYLYADEINQLEENLNIINNNTLKMSYGDTPLYVENGCTMDFSELNRLEGAIYDIYKRLINVYNGRRKFMWNFGMRGEL